jgi:hypothetical protein
MLIDPGAFEACFTAWAQSFVKPNFRTGSKNMLLYQRLIGRKSV